MKIKDDVFDNIAFWVLACATFLMPLFFLPPSWVSLSQAKISLFGITTILSLCFFLAERIKNGTISIPKKPIYVLFLLIPLIYIVSSFLSVNPHKSFIGGGFDVDTLHNIALFFIYTFLLASLARGPKRAFVILSAFFASVLLAGVLQIVRIFAGDTFSFGTLAVPALTLAGSWNDLTILFILFLGALVVLLGTVYLRKAVFYSLIALLVLPFFFFSLSSIVFDAYFGSISLSQLLSAFAVVLFAYVFSVRKANQSRTNEDRAQSTPVAPLIVVLVLALGITIFANPLGAYLTEKTHVVYMEAPLTWQATYDVAKSVYPNSTLLGTGPNSFAYDWNIAKPKEVNNSLFWNSDIPAGVGTIPTTFVTVGAIGFILWIIFYIFVVGAGIRILFGSKREAVVSPQEIMIAFGALFTTFVIFFYACGFLVIFAHFLFVGLLLSLDKTRKDKSVSLDSVQWRYFASIIVFIALIIALLFWSWRIVARSIAVYDANFAVSKSQNDDEALAWMNSAISLDSSAPVYYQIVSQIYLSKVSAIASLPANEAQSKQKEAQGYISSAIASALLSAEKDPTNFRGYVFLGSVYEYIGSFGVPGAGPKAVEAYLKASALSPTNPLPFILVAKAYTESGNFSLAKEALLKAITLKQDWNDAPDVATAINSIMKAIDGSGVKSTTEASSTKAQAKDAVSGSSK